MLTVIFFTDLTCKICDTVGFFGFRGLFAHVSRKHKGNHPLRLSCPKCGTRAKKSNMLLDHLKTSAHRFRCNGRRKDFKCQECGREFTMKVNLKAHMRQKHWAVMKVYFSFAYTSIEMSLSFCNYCWYFR